MTFVARHALALQVYAWKALAALGTAPGPSAAVMDVAVRMWRKELAQEGVAQRGGGSCHESSDEEVC